VKLCTFDGCEKPLHAKGLCDGHRIQLSEGRPLKPLRPRATKVPQNCTFEGCDRPHDAKGLCSGHNKQRYEGRPLKPLIVKRHGDWTLEKLLSLTTREGSCMVRSRKYSKVSHHGKGVHAHWLAYVLHTGEQTKGIQIHHTCANAKCINPEHLQRASTADNMLEMLGRRDYEAEIAYLKAENARLRALLLERESACG
jgi:hypothetical protein